MLAPAVASPLDGVLLFAPPRPRGLPPRPLPADGAGVGMLSLVFMLFNTASRAASYPGVPAAPAEFALMRLSSSSVEAENPLKFEPLPLIPPIEETTPLGKGDRDGVRASGVCAKTPGTAGGCAGGSCESKDSDGWLALAGDGASPKFEYDMLGVVKVLRPGSGRWVSRLGAIVGERELGGVVRWSKCGFGTKIGASLAELRRVGGYYRVYIRYIYNVTENHRHKRKH